jgi:hypothetical protein
MLQKLYEQLAIPREKIFPTSTAFCSTKFSLFKFRDSKTSSFKTSLFLRINASNNFFLEYIKIQYFNYKNFELNL